MDNKNDIYINDNKIFIEGKIAVITKESIKQAELDSEGNIIVLLSYPKGTSLSEEQMNNLLKFKINGEQVWRISYVSKMRSFAPVVGFTINGKKLSGSDFYGRAFDIDTITGEATIDGITK